jgi:hypothetical protein
MSNYARVIWITAKGKIYKAGFPELEGALLKMLQLDANVNVERVDLVLDKTGTYHESLAAMQAWMKGDEDG